MNPGAGECPVIKNLWVNGKGIVHIETSGAANITLVKDMRPFGIKVMKKGRAPITRAEFEIGKCKWFRLVVTGKNGCKAYTNAYFVDEIVD